DEAIRIKKLQKKGFRFTFISGSDNSNTQFAALALWAATRHGLPLERALDRLAKRFRDSQADDGSWKYNVQKKGWSTQASTGSGLLGLAVGHGLTATDETKKKAVKDPAIDNGLKWLGQWVGKNFGDDRNKGGFGNYSPINLYFLWTVERVGMLY